MTMVLATVLLMLWLIRTVRSSAVHVALWQRKEYRLDRMRAHLQLPSTRRELCHPFSMLKWAALALTLTSLAPDRVLLPVLTAAYAGEALCFLVELRRREVRRPAWTAKAFALLGAGTVAAGIPLWLIPRLPLAMLVSDRLIPFLVMALVAVFHPITRFSRTRTIRQATARRARLPDLTVIGITGSYGKSSAKEILATLLGDDERTEKTPANTNTEIGVAQFVLTRLRREHRIFVCEMAAYRQGEIARLCRIVHPKLGILTAIAPQHLALFGSRNAIRETKYELIQSLPRGGVALMNVDDPVVRELADQTTHCRVVRYGTLPSADVRATDIRPDDKGTSWTMTVAHQSHAVRLPLLGAHQVANALGAAAAAWVLGVPTGDMVARLKTLIPIPRTMEPVVLADGTLLIDDSYSANPDGVLAAVETLPLLRRERNVVVLTPMIELGPEAPAAHQRVGAALARRATHAFYTQRDFADDVAAGIRQAHGTTEFAIQPNASRIWHDLTKLRGPEAVILLEGRVPTVLRGMLRES